MKVCAAGSEPIVEGRADTVKAAVEELSEYLIIGERSAADRGPLLGYVSGSGFYREARILS